MHAKNAKQVFLTLLLYCCGLVATAQTLCPPNIDFEEGNFSNWICKDGSVTSSGNVNILNLQVGPPATGRHTIIPFRNTSTDLYGGFPVMCPNGSGYSVKLGNEFSGSEAEGLFYTYTIPAGSTNFAILYNYAIVLQNPGHSPAEQPRFRARVINLTDDDTLGCVFFDFTSSANLPGFKTSRVSPDVIYKDWTPISLNLKGFNGKTISVEFITSDCTLGAHFGYAYIDVNAQCNGTISGTTVCAGDTSATLVAPYGYASYKWYTDITFSQVLDSVQTVTISPAPAVGTIYPVIVSPFTGFGCKDTIYATITVDNKPISVAGADASVCRFSPVQLGTTPNPAYQYSWTPTSLLSNPIISNPTATLNTFNPETFYVKTTSRLSGCYSFDTVIISPIQVDTSIIVNGKNYHCIGEPRFSTVNINQQSSNIQWYLNNSPISGANSYTYTPTSAGNYKAKFEQNGCIDTTRSVVFVDRPTPIVKFKASLDTQCIVNNSFVFTNQSSIAPTDSNSYVWKFGDGTTSQVKDPTKSYSLADSYKVWLIATSKFNCIDSTFSNLKVYPNVSDLNFNWGGFACTNKETQIVNTTNENRSLKVNYLWNLDNGSTSILKNPLPFKYASQRTYNVTLQSTAEGCESYAKTITKPIAVFQPLPGIKYNDITIPYLYTKQLDARWNVGKTFLWSPATQLSNPRIMSPNFRATKNEKLLIAITDDNKCITTDTLQITVLTKNGLYLPNAFTPNNDGLNDYIRPYLVGMKGLKKFIIYDRLGNTIFYTTKDGDSWNGTYKGNPAEGGTYVWLLDFIDENNNLVSKKGSILLIR
jgi:gliding motility-associated-like protein